MNERELGKYKSWLTSAGIALAIGLWLATGQLSSDKSDTDVTIAEPSEQKPRSNVRIRTQTAEQIKADRARERFEARQARLEREQAEKEARRRARLGCRHW